MPWFPLPETITTGISHPLIRASDPAAAAARPGRTHHHRRGCAASGRSRRPSRLEALDGDGAVARHLTAQHLRHVGGIQTVGKGNDLLHAQNGAVRLLRFAPPGAAALEENLIVLLNPDDVGVEIHNFTAGGVLPAATVTLMKNTRSPVEGCTRMAHWSSMA